MADDKTANAIKKIDHNRYTALGIALAIGVVVFGVACQPKTDSPFSDKSVTRVQLDTQVASFNALIEGAYADLDEQARKQAILTETALSLVNQFAPFLGPLGIGGILTGLGVLGDNKRKDGLIKVLKTPGKTPA